MRFIAMISIEISWISTEYHCSSHNSWSNQEYPIAKMHYLAAIYRASASFSTVYSPYSPGSVSAVIGGGGTKRVICSVAVAMTFSADIDETKVKANRI